jgi:epoxyqueuosine reductase
MDEAQFRQVFRDSAIKRAKWRGLIRNTCIAVGNSGLQRGTEVSDRMLVLLHRISASQDALIAESALWAISRIQ